MEKKDDPVFRRGKCVGGGVRRFVQSASIRVKPTLLLLFLLVFASLAFAGCSATKATADEQSSSEASQDAVESDQVSAEINMDEMDFEYTDRDKDASYDADSATVIAFDGDTAEVKGDGASVQDCVVTIEQAGTYVVSGIATGGQVVVDAQSDDKVQVVLNVAQIHCDDGPSLYIKEADKVFVTLAEGTSNSLSDGEGYVDADDEGVPNAALFSEADLTINGSGTLDVKGSSRYGINSKDDLVITGGTFVVDAVEDALRGKDCVKIADGSFELTAGEGGIKSSNDEDGTRGFVCIDGGSLSIEAGDDAIHGESVLVVNEGDIEIASCEEGLEAEQVYINGGDVRVTSNDDALNASARGSQSDSAGMQEGAATQDPNADAAIGGAGDAGQPGGMENLPGGDAGEAGAAAGEAEDVSVANEAGGMPAAGGAGDVSAADETGDMAAADETGDMAAAGESGKMPVAGGGPGSQNGAGDLPGGAPSNSDGSAGSAGAKDPLQGKGSGAETPSLSDEAADGGDSAEGNPGSTDAAPDGMGRDGAAMPGSGASDSCILSISGGRLIVDASGDGLDSNGSLQISGGTVLVLGPESDGNSALDYESSAQITGGCVLALGPIGMAEGFTDAEQPYVTSQVSVSAGESVCVADEEGNVLVSLTATKDFQWVCASCSSMEEGEQYSLVVGGSVSDADSDGFAQSGSVEGGTSTQLTASVSADAAGSFAPRDRGI